MLRICFLSREEVEETSRDLCFNFKVKAMFSRAEDDRMWNQMMRFIGKIREI